MKLELPYCYVTILYYLTIEQALHELSQTRVCMCVCLS